MLAAEERPPDRLWEAIREEIREDRGGLGAAAQTAAEDPAAVLVPLSSGAGDLTMEAVVLPDGSGYLQADPLPALPGHRTYQLWAVLDDRVISAGVLGPDPSVVAFAAPPQTVALAVTEEQRGGVVSSSRPPVVVGEIRAA